MGSTDDEPAPARALLWVLGRGWQHDSSCRVWPVGGAGRSSSSATSTSTALPWLPHALCPVPVRPAGLEQCMSREVKQ